MRNLMILAVLALTVGVALAAAPRKGSVHAEAATTLINRDFLGSVGNLTVAPASADVVVIHKPHYVDQDSFTVRAGEIMNWNDLDIYGFEIIRATSTAVDVYWW